MTGSRFPVMKEQRQAPARCSHVRARAFFYLIDWVEQPTGPHSKDDCDRFKERHLGCKPDQLLIGTRRNATTETGAAIDAASAVSVRLW